MKRMIVILCVFIIAGKVFSQIYEIIDKPLVVTNPSLFPYGVNINMKSSSSVRWAREFNFSYNGKGNIFSFGVVANGINMEYGYIGGNRLDNSNTNYANPYMVFLPNGRVGIGTLSPKYLLDVNGTFRSNELLVSGIIKAREVKIEINAGADFVFSSDYNLKPLSEVESFVKKNKHLPEIPSEKEMIENGINVNEMQIKLLQKIEELTLYVIDLKKENEAIKKKLKELEK